ncbi:MAG TPA: N-acetylmuramoyl-L-alanine amidase [Kofleriaceae bacterium]|nr:N-acetylmuramoyl-L-alanine amidase [Kofleriaceae bacterium]
MFPGARPSNKIIIAGREIPVDAPVVNFRDPPYWNATLPFCIPTASELDPHCRPGGVPSGAVDVAAYTKNPRRYAYRPQLASYYSSPGKEPPIEAAKAVIKQFVVHHDGCNSAEMCFDVLQNERGLSVHFMLDNDGTIFQTIDLALMAYHAAEWNVASIGIEMCNRGDAKLDPNYYASGRFGPKRTIKPCKINGHTILAFEYTEPQLRSFVALCRALTRILPNIPAEYPQSSPGVQSWATLPRDASFRFSGYIGHYHLTEQKWDPGPFDFVEHCRQLRGALCFPVFARDDAMTATNPQPTVPRQIDDLHDAMTELYKLNEARAEGGFFPVGPWGESRLWHGGVHLVGKDRAPVFAPFPGRLIAARMGKSSAIGSCNFALMRHDLALGNSRVQFYALYMHLVDEMNEEKPVEWMTKPGWRDAGRPGDVVLLDEPIEAGALIGHVGIAGPGDLAKPQIHVEFFSNAALFGDVEGSPWTVVDGTTGGRFCDAKEINDPIDTDHSGTLERQELSAFYAGGGGQQMHFLVPLHVSEWTAEPSWSDALRVPKDFKKFKPSEIDQLVADQITPGLWWAPDVAAHCKLPADGIVYHYHPISFVGWFHEQLLEAATAAGAGPVINAADAREATSMGLKDDLADKEGTSMRSAASVSEDPCNAKLTLDELVQGFDAPECTP